MVKEDKKNSKRYPAVIMAVIMSVSSTALAGCGGSGSRGGTGLEKSVRFQKNNESLLHFP